MMGKILACFMVLPLAALAAPVLAFNTYAPGYQYQGPGYAIGWQNLIQGDQFSPAVSGTLDHFDVAIGWLSGDSLVNLYLMTDAGNTPGVILETIPIKLGPQFGQQGIALLALSVSHPFLQAGTNYWLLADRQIGTEQAAWPLNSIGAVGLHALGINGPGGAFDVNSGWTTSAFDVFVEQIPEPSTLTLVGLGGIALAFLRRRA